MNYWFGKKPDRPKTTRKRNLIIELKTKKISSLSDAAQRPLSKKIRKPFCVVYTLLRDKCQ